jgi:hypothetical protein
MKFMQGVQYVTAVFLIIGLSSSDGQAAKRKLRTGLILNCTSDVCKTDIRELHQDDVGAKDLELIFHPPAGVALDERGKGGIEIEGSGATHYVNALGADKSWLVCKWHAAARPRGDNGLAKGYCWINVLK